MEENKSEFRRVIRGLNTLLVGLKETEQDRLHQFVRSLEALILPDIGSAQKQFTHRCQTLAHAVNDTRSLLQKAFECVATRNIGTNGTSRLPGLNGLRIVNHNLAILTDYRISIDRTLSFQ